MRAGGIKPPLQHVAVNDHGSRQVTVASSLVTGACVNDQRSCGDLRLQVGWLHPMQASPGLLKKYMDSCRRSHSTSHCRPSYSRRATLRPAHQRGTGARKQRSSYGYQSALSSGDHPSRGDSGATSAHFDLRPGLLLLGSS